MTSQLPVTRASSYGSIFQLCDEKLVRLDSSKEIVCKSPRSSKEVARVCRSAASSPRTRTCLQAVMSSEQQQLTTAETSWAAQHSSSPTHVGLGGSDLLTATRDESLAALEAVMPIVAVIICRDTRTRRPGTSTPICWLSECPGTPLGNDRFGRSQGK
jgi:hypothetical protein